MDMVALIGSTLFVNNLLLGNLLGLCPVVGTSSSVRLSLGMGLATSLVLTFSVPMMYVFVSFVLVPMDLTYLQSAFMIMLIAFSVSTLEILIKNMSLVLYNAIGIYFPLITSNCAILGAGLLVLQDFDSAFEAGLVGLGSGLGFLMVLLIVAFIKEKVDQYECLPALKGYPMLFTSIGIIAVGFMGFL